jgi:ABC-type polar amino acid transport system ATPase subunit
MDFTAVTAANRPQVNRFIRERWFSTDMILRGAIVDMILTLDDGQILEENTPREFFGHPQNPRLRDFLSKVL